MNGAPRQRTWKNYVASTSSNAANIFSVFRNIKLQGRNASQGSTARSSKPISMLRSKPANASVTRKSCSEACAWNGTKRTKSWLASHRASHAGAGRTHLPLNSDFTLKNQAHPDENEHGRVFWADPRKLWAELRGSGTPPKVLQRSLFTVTVLDS